MKIECWRRKERLAFERVDASTWCTSSWFYSRPDSATRPELMTGADSHTPHMRRQSSRVAQKRALEAQKDTSNKKMQRKTTEPTKQDDKLTKNDMTSGTPTRNEATSKDSPSTGLAAKETQAKEPLTSSAILHVGDSLPNIELVDQDGQAVEVSTLRNVVIFTYPKVR